MVCQGDTNRGHGEVSRQLVCREIQLAPCCLYLLRARRVHHLGVKRAAETCVSEVQGTLGQFGLPGGLGQDELDGL